MVSFAVMSLLSGSHYHNRRRENEVKEIIGDCTLYLADCNDIIDNILYDCFCTDPPYGIGKKTGTIGASRAKNSYDSFNDTPEYISEKIIPIFEKITSKRGAVTPGPKMMRKYPEPKDTGIFYQPAACGMSYWGRTTWQPILFYGNDPRIGKTIDHLHYVLTEKSSCENHPCAKPQKGWDWLVNKVSLEGETVFDPFMGSGTTGVSCVKLGRKFVGIEISEKYFELACKRITEATRQTSLFAKKEKIERLL